MERILTTLLFFTAALGCNANKPGSSDSPEATADIPTFRLDADSAMDATHDSATDGGRELDVRVDILIDVEPDLDASEPDAMAPDSPTADAPERELPLQDASEPDAPDVSTDLGEDSADAVTETTPDAGPDMRACEGHTCDLRTPECEGASYLEYGPGECVIADDGIAECQYESFATDCTETGQVCTPSGCDEGGVIDLCVGGRSNTAHACAVHADGRLWCWGDSEFLQLGPDSTGDDMPTPVEVPVPAVVDVACGGAHVCALDRSGQVWCWGANGFGQIGGDLGVRSEPLVVSGLDVLPPLVAIEAGNNGTFGMTAGGSVFYWGALGIRNVLAVAEPTLLADDIAAMSANRNVVYLVPRTGLTQYIGSPGWGVLDADVLSSFEGDELTRVAGGWDHSCGVSRDGTGLCWGRDEGKSGDGSPEDMSHATPVVVLDLPPALDVAVAANSACAVTETHTVWCWGFDGLGLMGRGAVVEDGPLLAQEVNGFLRDVVQVRAGWNSMFARTGDGEVYSWGGNETQCLGPRAIADRRTPALVLLPD